MMNNKNLLPAVALLATLSILSGCEAIGTIFKAGVWVGIIGIVIVVIIIFWIIKKLGSK